MRDPRPLPPSLTDEVFSVSAARQLGVSTRRLRHHSLAAPIRGTRVPRAATREPMATLRALAAVCPAAVVSHGSAAWLWHLPVPARLLPTVRPAATTPADGSLNPIRRSGVEGHRGVLDPDDVVVINGLAVTSPERTFLDLAAHLTRDELVVLGDAMVCAHDDPWLFEPRYGLTTPELLRARVARAAGHRGVRRAREALRVIRVGSDSAQETRLRLAIVDAGLPEPEHNIVVPVAGRRRVVRPDVGYRDQRVSVQYDGGHHADPRQHQLDIERADLTAAAGWTEVRIGAHDLVVPVDHPVLGRVPRAVTKVYDALRVAEGRAEMSIRAVERSP